MSPCRADSKQLTEAKRESLFERMRECGRIGYITHSITAAEIAAAMLHRVPVSLNVIAYDATMTMLETILAKGVKVTKVFIDTVGDPEHYQTRLNKLFNIGALGGGGTSGRGWAIDFTVTKKADSLFKCVSAASIAAKVTRDKAIRDWVFNEPALKHVGRLREEGEDSADEDARGSQYEEDELEEEKDAAEPAQKRSRVADPRHMKSTASGNSIHIHPSAAGSGYPSDPKTKAWMEAHMDKVFGWPDVVRFSWLPAKDALQAGGVPVEWEEDVVEDEKQAKLSAFFITAPTKGPAKAAPQLKARSAWLRKRMIEPVATL
jgi:ribonuclease H2 subunit A